ncbi:MAG: hypothetical protein ACRD0U_04800 [Acidimicrobiales bacterium]
MDRTESLADVAGRLDAIAADLSVLRDELSDSVHPIEERIVALAETVSRMDPAPVGLDAGGAALLAATVAALARLEARLDGEFSALRRELAGMRELESASVEPAKARTSFWRPFAGRQAEPRRRATSSTRSSGWTTATRTNPAPSGP